MRTILTSELENTDYFGGYGDKSFKTRDKVYLAANLDFQNNDEVDDEEIEVDDTPFASDYAVMCGAGLDGGVKDGAKNKQGARRWLRTESDFSDGDVIAMNYLYEDEGSFIFNKPNDDSYAVFPKFNFDLDAFKVVAKISENKKGNYHTATIGLKFPYSFVGYELNAKLEVLQAAFNLPKTGKTYTGFMVEDFSFVMNEEYEFEGEKYVRVKIKKHNSNSEFENKTPCPKTGAYAWAKVEEIPFRIKNWNCLPKSINPRGNGSAESVVLEAEEGLIAMPFYPKNDEYDAMWQNSPIRAWLNGYDIYEELKIGNGNEYAKAATNFNFKEHNFLKECGAEELAKKIGPLKKEWDKEELAKKAERDKQIDGENLKKWNEWVEWANEKYNLDPDGGME